MPGRGHRRSAARAIAAMCAAAAVVGLAAAGCDSHSRPQAVDDPTSPAPAATLAPPSTSTQATSSSSTESPPTDPTASGFPSATAQIPEAIQVVRAFFAGLNYEIDNKGDEAKLVPLFTGDCTRCAASASTLQSIFLNGNTVRGGHYHIVNIVKAYATDVARVSVVVTESADPAQVIDKHGTVVRNYPGLKPTQQTFYVAVDHSPPVILAFLLGNGGQ